MAKTPKSPAAKPAKPAKATAATAAVEEPAAPAEAAAPAAVLKRKEFEARVAAASGVKRPEVKAVVEAALQALGDALASGEAVALPPFGKARVARRKETPGGPVLTVRLRRAAGKNPGGGGNDPLADADE